MNAAFDPTASAYDREFTYSRTGMAQRRQVWRYLDPMLRTPSMEVLELNCGTGIDAVHMARAGHQVLATDISSEMLKIAEDTARQHGVEDKVKHEKLAFHELVERDWHQRFHLVFSDFGGLNCIDADDLALLRDPIAEALGPKGRFVAVLMPDRCLAETSYFLLRGRWDEAFRRGRHDPVWAGLSGSGVHTWYHPPGHVAAAFTPRFRVVNMGPIGFFVPPSYLEPRFRHRPRTIDRLARWDEWVGGHRWLARYADHYLIDLEKLA